MEYKTADEFIMVLRMKAAMERAISEAEAAEELALTEIAAAEEWLSDARSAVADVRSAVADVRGIWNKGGKNRGEL